MSNAKPRFLKSGGGYGWKHSASLTRGNLGKLNKLITEEGGGGVQGCEMGGNHDKFLSLKKAK